MKEEEKLIDKFGRKSPWTVPEGYFESVRIEIKSKLPEYPTAPEVKKVSKWELVKPYFYLAAMFAGIWCMMSVIYKTGGTGASLSLDNPPAQVAAYMGEPEVTNMLYMQSASSDVELMEEVSESYDCMEDFEKDFGYNLEPEYENIDL